MRAACALVLAVVPVLLQAHEAALLRVDRTDASALERALVDLAQQRLESTGLVIDREHVWLNVSGAVPPAGEIEALPTWSNVAGVPALPLTFELQTKMALPVRATLAVRLQRPVWVALRRLRKGSHVSCDDLGVELKDIRDVQRGSFLTACEVGPESSVLRDVAEGEALHTSDVGREPDVQLGAPVQVSASSGGVNVTTMAIALADARVGDEIDVRLQRPARTLKTRVTGRGAVQLLDEAP